MCTYVNMVCDVAPGAAPVLLVLLNPYISKDVYVTANLRQGLRLTQLNRTYQVRGMLLVPAVAAKQKR